MAPFKSLGQDRRQEHYRKPSTGTGSRAQQPLALDSLLGRTFNMSTARGLSTIPPALRSLALRKIYVDYVRARNGGGAAAAAGVRPTTDDTLVIKLDLACPDGGGTEPPQQDLGVEIRMRADCEDAGGAVAPSGGGVRGLMLLKSVPYHGRLAESTRTLYNKRVLNVTLGQLLECLLEKDLQHFSFVTLDGECRGGRDWMTQVVKRLQLANIMLRFRTFGLPVRDLCPALALRWTQDPEVRPTCVPIMKGRFDYYNRVVVDDMACAGTLTTMALVAQFP